MKPNEYRSVSAIWSNEILAEFVHLRVKSGQADVQMKGFNRFKGAVRGIF
jgi:hypothetical protein